MTSSPVTRCATRGRVVTFNLVRVPTVARMASSAAPSRVPAASTVSPRRPSLPRGRTKASSGGVTMWSVFALAPHQFLRHHACRAHRQLRAGEDPPRRPGLERLARTMPRTVFARDTERFRGQGRDGIAVHHAQIAGRIIAVGRDRLREHAAQRPRAHHAFVRRFRGKLQARGQHRFPARTHAFATAFQIGTSCLSRSMNSATNANASARWRDLHLDQDGRLAHRHAADVDAGRAPSGTDAAHPARPRSSPSAVAPSARRLRSRARRWPRRSPRRARGPRNARRRPRPSPAAPARTSGSRCSAISISIQPPDTGGMSAISSPGSSRAPAGRKSPLRAPGGSWSEAVSTPDNARRDGTRTRLAASARHIPTRSPPSRAAREGVRRKGCAAWWKRMARSSQRQEWHRLRAGAMPGRSFHD